MRLISHRILHGLPGKLDLITEHPEWTCGQCPRPRLVALVVSGINLFNYCLAAHLEILGRMGIDKSLSRKLALDYTSASVEPKVMELFRFADKLTRHPADIEKPDVDRLREAGWDDGAILETVLVVSLYACANRFSAAIGLITDF